MEIHHLHIAESFKFEVGETINGIDIVYHTSGSYSHGKPVVWICHALTANSDAEDWWPEMVGPGKAIDTQRYFVVCVNMLGSPYGSSGPVSTINPQTGKPYLLSFPRVTVRDIVQAIIFVRKHLGIERIDLLVGSSIGGFQAVEWAVTEPDVIANALFIATGARVNAWTSATLEAQRMALDADPSFREQTSTEGGKQGLRCARAQALLTYRSFEGYRLTQSEEEDDTLFASRAASYERYQGDKLAARFDAYSYLSVIDSADSHNVGRHRGGVAQALSTIQAHVTMVCITSDGLFPPSEMRQWAAYIPHVQYLEIESDFGHDGFLLETDSLTRIVRKII